MFQDSHVVVSDETRRARLRWRAKRGMLENDILMTRFFEQHVHLTDDDVYGLDMLLDLPDSELFELVMQRKELSHLSSDEHLMSAQDMIKAAHVLELLRLV